MSMMRTLFLCALFGTLCLCSSLDSQIYTTFQGNPCVLLLDKSGSYGCKTSSNGVVAPLQLLETPDTFNQFIKAPPSDPVIVVMPASILAIDKSIDLLAETGRVKGALLLEGESPKTPFSPALNMPDDKQVSSGFSWNPAGNGLLKRNRIPFPLWMLGAYESEGIEERALYNRDQANVYPKFAAEIITFMHPEDVDNSYTCLRRGTCLPLGGSSTWTPVVPLDPKKDIVMAVASMDSKTLFQLKSIGANSDMSGTIALMAALDAIVSNSKIDVTQWPVQPIFAWFDAESFGNLGSRKFFSDIHSAPCDITGTSPLTMCAQGGSAEYKKISFDKIKSIIEMKQVGGVNATGLFVHTQDHDSTTYTAQSVLSAGKTLKTVHVDKSASDTPSVPPSSVLAILGMNSTFVKKSVVVADHAAEYTNGFFDSTFDNYDNVLPSLLCDASTLLYRTLYSIGSGIPADDPTIKSATVNCTLVQALLYCLAKNNTCPEKIQILPGINSKNTNEFPVHYSGVWRDSTYTQHQKFVHDWVHNKTAFYRGGNCSNGEECKSNETCIAGQCQISATYYHQATSMNVELVVTDFSAGWRVIDTNSSEPLWTESNWQPLSLRVFKLGDPAQDYIFIGIAVLELIVVVVAVIVLRRNFSKYFRVL